MPADLPPGALEEMERLLEWSASDDSRTRALAHITLQGTQYLQPILALAREALTLRERVAQQAASLDACQAGHTHQAKRAEAAEAQRDGAWRNEAVYEKWWREAQAEAARLRDLLRRADKVVLWDCEPALGRAFQVEVEAALRPAAPDPSCQGSLDNCGPTTTEEQEQSHG